MQKVDVVIPVYRPDHRFLQLMELLSRQTEQINHIILMNTEKECFDLFTEGTDFYSKYQNVIVRHVSKKEFDHGNTRNMGTQLVEMPYFMMMTQDAMPADTRLIEKLLGVFSDERVAMAYARQLPAEDAGEIEIFTRQFNYPEVSCIKTQADLEHLGIKTYFASNVCAMYRKEIFDAQGGFTRHTIFNEDMIYAGGVVQTGFAIAYVAEACVIHSHNYSGWQQMKRNFDLGVSQADHPQIFQKLPSVTEGKKLIKLTIQHLIQVHKPLLVLRLVWQSGCKYAGFLLGTHYRRLPPAMIRLCTMNREYWSTILEKIPNS